MIESPVRRQAGQVVPFPEMKAITGYSRDMGIGTHLDGARLYMMSSATGVPVMEYADLFDTVYVFVVQVPRRPVRRNSCRGLQPS